MKEYSNKELTIDMIPGKKAKWIPEISDFALTFNGYDYLEQKHPDAREIWDVINPLFKKWINDFETTKALPDDLSELRCFLFFIQRNRRWTEQAPGAEQNKSSSLVHLILEKIRTEVNSKNVDIDT
ncbi:hypothetical protein [Mariprofundus sp. KV]|uniref:hypothetical protein n=1 Tax=Mariprofundus sp. KV TaxID=2608715 RepID=UPI0015A47434|nr:hypothetical protein [Mariprofundus sp. KV]NWF37507.1 hypothetical protein [Mariprofundus sp. KV]